MQEQTANFSDAEPPNGSIQLSEMILLQIFLKFPAIVTILAVAFNATTITSQAFILAIQTERIKLIRIYYDK